MKYFLSLFFVLIKWNFQLVQCDELVSVLIPKTVYGRSKLFTFVEVHDLDMQNKKTKIAVEFRNKSITYELVDEGHKKLNFSMHNINTRSTKTQDLHLTFYRETTKGGNIVKQCNTHVKALKVENLNFNIFIQLDKPVYKPGDVIQFRIIVLDKFLMPHKMNNIDIKIKDPYGRVMAEFDDFEEDENLGIFINNYTIGPNAGLGDWSMTVIADKKKDLKKSKTFSVSKDILPLYSLYLGTSSKNYLPNHKLVISIHARYSFGEYVTGLAELTIMDKTSNETRYKKEFEVSKTKVLELDFRDDLGVTVANQKTFEAFVTFTEPETGITANKTTVFNVHNSPAVKIRTVHSKTYVPGLPFNFKMFIRNWNDEKFIASEPAVIDYKYIHKDGTETKLQMTPSVLNGAASEEVIIPIDVVTFEIECKYSGSYTYRTRVEREKVETARNSLTLEYLIKKDNDTGLSTAEVYANSAARMNKVLVVVLTKLGVSDVRIQKCSDETVCSVPLDIKTDMMPHFTVEIYHVRDENYVEHGSVKIETEHLASNTLTMELKPDITKTRTNVSLTFETDDNSKIYLLAIDKRLKIAKDGNDVTKGDFVEAYSKYDSETELLLEDLTTWKTCTAEEIKRVNSGVQISAHSSDTFTADDDNEDIDDDTFEEDDIEEEAQSTVSQKEDDDFDSIPREEFPEAWIFETIDYEDGPMKKVFSVPDSMTSWHISAFSLNQHSGIAVTKPQELTVRNNFFIKFDLPYSIRTNEILKIDVLVFNYLNEAQSIDVKVVMKNPDIKEFQFVEYGRNGKSCEPIFSNKTQIMQSVKVPKLEMKKLSYYVRINVKLDRSNEERIFKIQCAALATDSSGTKYKDAVRRSLKVRPVGVKFQTVQPYDFIVKDKSQVFNLEYKLAEGNVTSSCIVNTDYLTNTINLHSGFVTNSGNDLEQMTSNLKGNVQVYKYLQMKKKLKKKQKQSNPNYFKQQYQEILQERGRKRFINDDKCGFIAHYINAIVPAMELDLIKAEKNVIQEEVLKLITAQEVSGKFKDFGTFPKTNQNEANNRIYFETAFVLISLMKAQNYSKNDSLKEVIDKGFVFLENPSNVKSVRLDGLSIAAYAYALGSKYDESRTFNASHMLDQIEQSSTDFGKYDKCYKIRRDDSECDLVHTAYTALAYLTLNQMQKAMPAVYWIIKMEKFYSYNGYAYSASITSEPVAQAAALLDVSSTNFVIKFKGIENEKEKIFKYPNEKNETQKEFSFAPNTDNIAVTLKGSGYCSVTRINQITVSNQKLIPYFNVRLDPNIESSISNERIVRVCTTYDGTNSNKFTLFRVVYEVELPSGYEYSGIKDEQKFKKMIQKIEARNKKSLVFIYFNEFHKQKDYCVDVKAIKAFEVKEPLNAGVKVYDFEEKASVAVEFYNFKSASC